MKNVCSKSLKLISAFFSDLLPVLILLERDWANSDYHFFEECTMLQFCFVYYTLQYFCHLLFFRRNICNTNSCSKSWLTIEKKHLLFFSMTVFQKLMIFLFMKKWLKSQNTLFLTCLALSANSKKWILMFSQLESNLTRTSKEPIFTALAR